MNRYTVALTTEAENNLAEIWLDAADREAVTSAEAALHGLLANDPIGNGTLVAEDLYKLTYSPLVAFYSVDSARLTVEIAKIWRPS